MGIEQVSVHLTKVFDDRFAEVVEVAVNELMQLHNEGTEDSRDDEGNDIPITFDTLVCTGLSGVMVVPTLARELTVALGKKVNLLVVRKGEKTHGMPLEGRLGNEWLFVDDFICHGDTIRKVYKAVTSWKIPTPDKESFLRGSDSTFQGVYEYRIAHQDWASEKIWSTWQGSRHYATARKAKTFYLSGWANESTT